MARRRYTIAFPFPATPAPADNDAINEVVNDSNTERKVRAKMARRAKHRADRRRLTELAIDIWHEMAELAEELKS